MDYPQRFEPSVCPKIRPPTRKPSTAHSYGQDEHCFIVEDQAPMDHVPDQLQEDQHPDSVDFQNLRVDFTNLAQDPFPTDRFRSRSRYQ